MKNKKRTGQPLVQVVSDDTVDMVDTEGGWEVGKGTFQKDTFEFPEAPAVPAPVTKLVDVDKLALDLARERRKTALAEAKTALAQNDNAELSYKYVILQIYMKYGLTDADAISEAGDIIKGGALPRQQ